ncbi:hypothetical protein NP493_2127g00000 [Ridgeia piscesae]|uniref:Uncharacterized protein n=1 Tax=Ridgeia piscesae TaxID=27915 RepID=A0AAD9JLX4_RIDPI|nr:hypothetical protein NP493_2127g00000 [Ridgeia piscesae]
MQCGLTLSFAEESITCTESPILIGVFNEGDVEKVTVEKDGGTRGQEMREVDTTGGKMKGRKEVRVDVAKRKSITRTMTGRKETGKKGTKEKAAGGKITDQGDAKRRSYSEAVIEWVLRRTERVFMGDSI